jgi:uncharacterized protein (TIGR03545 family)
MAQKSPKFFTRKFSEEQFTKKILNRTFNEKDKEFLSNIFSRDDNSIYSLKEDLTKKEIKVLKKIRKTIKKNTGVVEKGKLIVFCVIVGAIIIFNIVFRDMLVENALETSLRSLFGAKADINSLVFDIFGARISLTGCKVANSEKPFRNLFELGKSEIDLNMTELLKGKFVVTNIECQDIQWNTVRKTSGALGRRPAGDESSKAAEGEKALPFSLDIGSIDVGAIIESEKENIKSIERIEEANRIITGLTTQWLATVDGFQKKIDECSKAVDDVTKINVKKIKTPQDIQKAYTTIEKATKLVTESGELISKTAKEVEKDSAVIEEEKKKIEEAITSDKNYLLSFINTPQEGAQRIFSSISKKFLKENLGEFYSYALKGIDVLKNLDTGKKEKKVKPPSRAGYKIQFPGEGYPNFIIENASFSVGSTTGPSHIAVQLTNISSAPDLTDGPSELHFLFNEDKRNIELDGAIDVREKSEDLFSLDFKAEAFPLSIHSGLELLGITSLNATILFKTDISINKANETEGTLTVKLSDIDLSMQNTDNIIYKNIDEILSSASEISVQASYSISQDGEFTISARSSIDRLIAEKIGAMIDATIKEAEEKIQMEVERFISEALGENKALSDAFHGVEKTLDGNLTDIASYEKAIEEKIKSIEKKAKDIEKGLEKKIQDALPKLDLKL